MDATELEALRDKMTHRGPDDCGTWVDEGASVGLAHRRLSIIDLSAAGRQPMASACGSLVLVFNGEIYNYRDLRRELQELGRVFRSHSDTEVVIQAYDEWGLDALDRLNGMFAFALFDRRAGKLVIARDRFGEKPLYYYRRDGVFLFASELKAIEALPGFDGAVDHDQLSLYFLFGYVPYPHSIYEHVSKLPPAHYLTLDVATLDATVRPYWQGMERALAGPLADEPLAAAVERVDFELRRSVERRLVADVPVGAFLSGGIDSSLVVGMAMELQGDFKTFAIGFEDEEHDEAPYAREIARHFGSDHREYYITADEARDVLVELPDMYDEPFVDSSAIPMYLVSRLARAEVKVALSGDGGDEMFGGYTTYPLLRRLLPLLRVPGAVRRLAGAAAGYAGAGRVKKHAALLDCDEPWQLFMYANERMITKMPDARALLNQFRDERLAGSEFVAACVRGQAAGPVNAALYADAKTYMVDDILTKVDRASMAVSLETRIPFLDPHIAEYAMGLTAGAKLGPSGRERKQILRALLARYLPRSLFERPKRGFSVPLARWLREDLRWLVGEYLDSGDLGREGLFNVPFVERLVAEHMSGRRDREAVLWALIFWEMWRRKRKIT